MAKLSWRPFEEARAFVHSLKLSSKKEWDSYRQLGNWPADIPTTPYLVYKEFGWTSWGDWLGTKRLAYGQQNFRSFQKARTFMHGLKLKNESEWIAFCKGRLPEKGTLPADIPISPRVVYAKQGWAGLGDWLGTGYVATRRRIYWPFHKARTFARSLGLKNQNEWFDFCKGKMPSKGKAPPNISATPHNTYAGNGWNGWGDWLGTNNVATYNREYRKFEDARTFVRSLGLKNRAEWQEFCQQALPLDIPANPNRVYTDKGWAGMGDWLGTGRIATNLRKYRSFKQARKFARSLGLSGVAEWRQFCNGVLQNKGSLPSDIPSKPDNRYVDEGWSGYSDWLGTGRTSVRKSRNLG